MKKILFVDDEEGMHQIFRMLLKREAREGLFSVEYFTSASQCLAYAEGSSSLEDLVILTDISMPGMDGFELLERIREKFPQVPVVVISAHESDVYLQKAKRLGAIAYLTKPLEIAELKKLL